MLVEDQLQLTLKLAAWLDESVDGLQVPATDRARMAAGSFDQVHENHKAIRLLVKKRLTGAAWCLVRPTFESYIRGLWLMYCAIGSEIEAFIADRPLKSMNDLIEDIEKVDGFREGVLSNTKKGYWAAMCSYAHGGYLQVVRRNTDIAIQRNYSDDEIIEVLRFSSAIAILAASEIFKLAERDDLGEECIPWLDILG